MMKHILLSIGFVLMVLVACTAWFAASRGQSKQAPYILSLHSFVECMRGPVPMHGDRASVDLKDFALIQREVGTGGIEVVR